MVPHHKYCDCQVNYCIQRCGFMLNVLQLNLQANSAKVCIEAATPACWVPLRRWQPLPHHFSKTASWPILPATKTCYPISKQIEELATMSQQLAGIVTTLWTDLGIKDNKTVISY